MLWVAINESLENHPKLLRLSGLLEVHRAQAKGHLISLWLWAMTYAPHGDVSAFSGPELASACGWDGSSKRLSWSLKKSGWIDKDGKLHDWEEHTLSYWSFLEKAERRRELTRDRVRAFRERKKKDRGDVTHDVTPGNTLTVQYRTVPYKNPPLPPQGGAGGDGQGQESPKASDPENGVWKSGGGDALDEVVAGFKIAFGNKDLENAGWDSVYLRGIMKHSRKLLTLFDGDAGKCLDCIDGIVKHAKARGWSDWTPKTIVDRAGDWAAGRMGK